MAGRYDFHSPGAAATRAIQEFLLKERLEERQAQLDEEERRKQRTAEARAQAQLELQQKTEQRMGEFQQQQQAALDDERRFRRATTLSQQAMPGDVASGEARALLQEQGYGGQVNWAPPIPGLMMQGPLEGDAQGEEGRPTAPGTPGAYRLRGGLGYLQAQAAQEARAEAAREAAADRAAIAEQNRLSREEIAAGNRQSRESIAAGQQAISGALTGLRGEQIQGQINAQQAKVDEADALTQRQYDASQSAAQSTLDTLARLATYDPKTKTATLTGAGENLFGMRVPGVLINMMPGSDTATARADLRQLLGGSVVDLINEMKNQSKTGATGFGSLAAPELQILREKASILSDPNIGDEAAAQAMAKIYELANKALAAPKPARRGASPAPAGGSDALLDELLK